MANKDVFKIEGFKELNDKLKKLTDDVKRNEILKIQRKAMIPFRDAYKRALPMGSKKHTRYVMTASNSEKEKGGKYKPGNLKESVRIKTVPKKAAKGNPMVQVLPDKTSKADGYYRFMVVKKGFKGKGRGSRKGSNTVVPEARDAAYQSVKDKVLAEASEAIARHIQKRIDKL